MSKKPATQVQLEVGKRRVDSVVTFIHGDTLYMNGRKYAVVGVAQGYNPSCVSVRLSEVL